MMISLAHFQLVSVYHLSAIGLVSVCHLFTKRFTKRFAKRSASTRHPGLVSSGRTGKGVLYYGKEISRSN